MFYVRYLFQGLHKWLYSLYISPLHNIYAQDLRGISLHVDVYGSRLFPLTTVREVSLSDTFGSVTFLPQRAHS